MILMKCSACGHALEVADSTPIANLPCPACGQRASLQPQPTQGAGNADTRILDGAQLRPTPDAERTQAADSGANPFLHPSVSTVSSMQATDLKFDYLSPALGPDELGWLAHYRVVRVLGEGGMGVVFEAIDTHLQRSIALKVMKPDIAQDEMARQRFLREARATAAVKSDHIVIIHQVGLVREVPFLAMEYLQGEPLDRWLQRNRHPSIAETLRLGIEIARGLASAHALGLIHRDIKPANIWLEAPSGRAKILDFGLARISNEQAALTHTGLVLGTPAYMAPEQAEGLSVDARCDLFSLGCVLYELVAGERPFDGATTMAILLAVANKEPIHLTERNLEAPPALVELIHGLLAKKPANRPNSAAEVVAELESIAEESGIAIGTPTSGTSWSKSRAALSGSRPRKRNWRGAALAGAGAVLAVGFLIWFFWPRVETPAGPAAGSRATAPGVTDKTILLGMSGPFNGPAKELGREMERGIKAYFRHINSQGGVAGRKLELIALDDEYEPDLALARVKELHEERKVFAMIGNIGTPTAAKTLPYALQKKILFFGAFTGAKLLRQDPPDRYVFNYRAGYDEETTAIVKYLVEVRNVRPEEIAVFTQNDAFGDDGFHGVVKALRALQRDPKEIVRVRYERNSIDVKAAVDEIKQRKDLRAVVMVATYKPAAAFIGMLKETKRDLIFTNVSFVGSAALGEELREMGPTFSDGVIVTQVVPPIDSGASAVVKYREVLNRYYPTDRPSFISLEGYIAAAVLTKGIEKVGDNLTTDRLIEALESIRDLDLGLGAPISFGPSDHQASHKVWGTILDKSGQFRLLELH